MMITMMEPRLVPTTRHEESSNCSLLGKDVAKCRAVTPSPSTIWSTLPTLELLQTLCKRISNRTVHYKEIAKGRYTKDWSKQTRL